MAETKPRKRAPRKVAEPEPETEVQVQVQAEEVPPPADPVLLADIYPAKLTPWPAEIPRKKVRAVITDQTLTVLWEGPRYSLERVDYAVNEAETGSVNHAGGLVNGMSVERGPGCKCGSRQVQNAKVY